MLPLESPTTPAFVQPCVRSPPMRAPWDEQILPRSSRTGLAVWSPGRAIMAPHAGSIPPAAAAQTLPDDRSARSDRGIRGVLELRAAERAARSRAGGAAVREPGRLPRG